MSSFFSGVLGWLYPERCGICGRFGADLCAGCRAAMVPSEGELVYLAPEVAPARAAFVYAGAAGAAVRRLKYARATGLARAMAAEIARVYAELGAGFDVAMPVPIHWRRRAERGFNQAELLASELPIPVRLDALRRVRHTPAQARLAAAERGTNLVGAFASEGVAGARILLVDDVATSGHTARECARALRAAGAREVGLVAFAVGQPGDGA